MFDQGAIAALILIGLAIAVGLAFAFVRPEQPPNNVVASPERRRQRTYRSGKVRNVIDGDTVIVATGLRTIRIRLDGIDCPECGQRWGDTAKYGLIKLIGGRRIRFEEHGVDKYDRTVATIYVKNGDRAEYMNVNARMVMLGHAWVSPISCQHLTSERAAELFKLQAWAKRKRVGLWRDPNPVAPWKYRWNING